MTNDAFIKVATDQLEKSKEILIKKGNEYHVSGTDRLGHFKRTAAMLGITPEQALMGMLAKHIISISDMVASLNTFSNELWSEKITDSINYLILLKALVEENNE